MPVPTLTVLASLLQIHGPGATIQSDHQGIDALLGDIRGQIQDAQGIPPKAGVTEAAFRRGGFVRGGAGFRRGGAYYGGGAFRKGAYVRPGGAFRRGGFARV